MRVVTVSVCAITFFTLAGCAQIIGRVAAVDAADKAKACIAAYRATPEYQLIAPRLWQFDDTDTATKLSDPNPLTPSERNALVQVHNKAVQCRQIIISHDNQFAAWETPYWQDYFQRTDEIFYKLASGELPVGIANKLSIESKGTFQAAASRGNAQAVQAAEVQRQQAAEAMMRAGAQLAASQPRMTTTNCTWMGNTLNCTSMR
jgi:hypothetical protein